MEIIRAKPEDASVLTEIAFAAKRHWGYPERWMTNWSPLLTLTPQFIRATNVYAAVLEGKLVGFHALVRERDKFILQHLWVLPEAMGRGVGRRLFTHALERARALGGRRVELESDPNAEGFYLRMGARKVGVSITELDGQPRELPLFVMDLG